MLLRIQFGIVLVLMLVSSGCAPRGGDHSERQTTFNDHHEEEVAPPAPQPIVNYREYNNLNEVSVPEIVQQRDPVQYPQMEKPEPQLHIGSPIFNIDKPNSTVTLTFTATTRHGSEEIRLKGQFDRNVSPWYATLYATDEKIKKERRVQALFLCTTIDYCDSIKVEILYYTDGRLIRRQFNPNVEGPRLAMSGDKPEELPSPSTPRTTPETHPTPPVTESVERPQSLSTIPYSPVAPSMPKPSQAPPVNPVDTQPALAERPPVVVPPPQRPPETPAQKPPAKSVTPAPKVVKVVAPPPTPKPAPVFKEGDAIEFDGLTNMGNPEKSEWQVQGLDDAPDPSPEVDPIQAIGHHSERGARLEKANYLPGQGPGYVNRAYLLNPNVTPETDRSLSWGTKRMVEFIERAGKFLSETYPDERMIVTNVSLKGGGRANGHDSHRTGLDADIRYLTKSGRESNFTAVTNGRLDADFDIEKNWVLFKSICRAKNDWIIVIFVDEPIKQSMCQHAKKLGEPIDDPNSLTYQCLRSLLHTPDSPHNTILHLRLYCPKTLGCQNKMVSLPNATGCVFK